MAAQRKGNLPSPRGRVTIRASRFWRALRALPTYRIVQLKALYAKAPREILARIWLTAHCVAKTKGEEEKRSLASLLVLRVIASPEGLVILTFPS